MSAQILNLEAVEKAELHLEPFPYMIVDNIINMDRLHDVLTSFPDIQARGSFPLSAVSCQGSFQELMRELQDSRLKELIAKKFDLDLKENPAMVTLRGYTTQRDGHIHVDSRSKLITVLIYLNNGWQSPDGRLRLLYNNHDLSRYAAEIEPSAGRCVIFKVTPDCWHGHTAFEGPRRSIQLNYVTSAEQLQRHVKRHRFSAFLKKIFKKDEARSTY